MSDLGANPDRDTAFRDRAKVVALALKKLAIGMLTNEDAMLQIRGYGYAQAVLKLPADLMHDIGLPEISVPIRLITREDSDMGAAYMPPSFVGGVGRILLPILPDADWFSIYRALHSDDPRMVAAAHRHLEVFQDEIDAWFERRKTYIVHEMTHMFDFLRVGKALPVVSAHKHGRAAYLNSAIEFNAHFQQMIAEFEERAAQLPHALQDAVVSDLNTFWGVVRQTEVYRGAWAYLTPKNQRKFYVRAAQYWQSIQPQGSRKKAIPFPDTRQAEQVFVSREAPREHIFDRLQREISERRRRR